VIYHILSQFFGLIATAKCRLLKCSRLCYVQMMTGCYIPSRLNCGW